MLLTLGLGLLPGFMALFKEPPCYSKLFPFCSPVCSSCETAGQDLFMTFKPPLAILAQFLRGEGNSQQCLSVFICEMGSGCNGNFFKAEVSLNQK